MHLWGVILTAWTYATPLFYPTSILMDWMWTIMQFNPMYYYVTYFRDIALNGVTPSLGANVICLGCGVATLVIGFAVFRKQQKNSSCTYRDEGSLCLKTSTPLLWPPQSKTSARTIVGLWSKSITCP